MIDLIGNVLLVALVLYLPCGPVWIERGRILGSHQALHRDVGSNSANSCIVDIALARQAEVLTSFQVPGRSKARNHHNDNMTLNDQLVLPLVDLSCQYHFWISSKGERIAICGPRTTALPFLVSNVLTSPFDISSHKLAGRRVRIWSFHLY